MAGAEQTVAVVIFIEEGRRLLEEQGSRPRGRVASPVALTQLLLLLMALLVLGHVPTGNITSVCVCVCVCVCV